MATKTFEIEINGISQSVSAVDALLAKLDALDDKINSLSDVDTSDLKINLESIRKDLETNADNWEDISDRIEDVTQDINSLERAYNSLENPFKVQDIKQYNEEVEDISESIKDVEKAADKIDGLGGLSTDLERANAGAKDLASSLNKVQRAEDQLGTKLNINIGGLSLQFDDVNQAIGVLEDKLYQLAANGQRNSAEFAEITQQVVTLRQAVVSVDNEIDNAFSGGLNRLIGGFESLASIASIGEGINQLFGIQGLDESIQKFTALSLILQGIRNIQIDLADKASIAAKAYKALSTIAEPLGNLLSKPFEAASNSFTNFTNTFKYTDLVGQLNELTKVIDGDTFGAFQDLHYNLIRISSDFENIPKGVEEAALKLGDVEPLLKHIEDLFVFGDLTDEQAEKARKAVEEFRQGLGDATIEAGIINNKIQELNKTLLANGVVFVDGVPKINLLQKALIKVAAGVKVVAAAFKTLAKSTIIFAALQLAMEALTWAFNLLSKVWTKFAGDDSLVGQFESTTQAIEATNNSLNKYITNLQRLADTKVISNQTRINDSIEEYTKALNKAIASQQALNAARKDGAKPLENNLDTNNTWFTGSDIKNVEDFTKQFELLQKAVQAGTDRVKALKKETTAWYEVWKSQYWDELWQTEGDARADLAEAEKAIISDIQYRINNLDLSKGTEEIKKFIDLLDTPMYQTSLANIEKLFPEDEYARVLSANIRQIQDYYSQISNLQKEAEVEAQRTAEQIATNNVAAIRNRFQRERAELNNSYQKELKDAADNEELKQSIRNKYATQRANLLKSQGNEVKNIQNQINSNQIAAMQDGLQKRLAELENSRQQEIQSARQSEILVGQQIAAINKKYNALVLEAKKEFYENRKKLMQDYSNQYRQLQREIYEIEVEIATSRVNLRAQDQMEALGFTKESIENVRNYYDQIRDIANKQAERIAEINKEQTQIGTDNSIEDENLRNKERLEAIKQNYEDGLISKEDYDKAIQDENDIHYKKLEVITRQGEQKLIEIQKEYDQTAKNNNITAINERISAINDAYSNIDVQTKTSKLGIIDYGATKKELLKAKGEYSTILKQIGEERDNLQKSFDNKEISFGDFRQAKKELDSLEKEVVQSQQSIGQQLDTLLNTVIQSVTQYVSQYVSTLGDIWSTYNDIQMMRFEQEQARLEEEYDMLEEAYQKQEELTQKHTDKLADIEDELKTSRGDRRAHLIEQLNAERAAQIASLQEEQRIEKEKEINQKKQDALEKKRREQEKKNSIVQATINTFTAVTNALAVQPWFVGLALSAVALAMGMAQVAQIKKQKYAKGGLLKGNSHATGGIPVGQTGIEVEGDEYVVNKNSTKKNLPLIDYINRSNKRLTKEDLLNWYDSGKQNVTKQTKTKFATGGVIPTLPNQSQEQTIVIEDDRPIVAQIVDIVNSADNYRQIQVLSGLSGKTV